MPVPEDEMIASTVDWFVTENVLNPKATPSEVSDFLRQLKTTGQVVTTTNQGGVRSVMVIERLKLSEEDSNEVRRVLGMDYEVEVDE